MDRTEERRAQKKSWPDDRKNRAIIILLSALLFCIKRVPVLECGDNAPDYILKGKKERNSQEGNKQEERRKILSLSPSILDHENWVRRD